MNKRKAAFTTGQSLFYNMSGVITVIIVLLLPFFVAVTCDAKDTPHYKVVSEYIRSLGAMYNIQQTVEKEFQEDTDKENPAISKMMSAIRSSTRFKLELSYSIAALKQMSLKKPFETLIPNTISFYQEKIKLHNELISILKKFLVDVPEEGVDYSKMVGRMPEITASVEYIDESIFNSMPLVFALLIDEKTDKEGHMSHLNITKAQRQKLIDTIDTLFGSSLDKENKNWTVASASLLKTYLLKDYKCKDEW